jgi:hypothetical protein
VARGGARMSIDVGNNIGIFLVLIGIAAITWAARR